MSRCLVTFLGQSSLPCPSISRVSKLCRVASWTIESFNQIEHTLSFAQNASLHNKTDLLCLFLHLAMRFQISWKTTRKRKKNVSLSDCMPPPVPVRETSDTGETTFSQKRLECRMPPRRYNLYRRLKLIICHEINHCPTLNSSSKVLQTGLMVL